MAALASCSDEPPAGGNGTPDTGSTTLLCDQATPCPGGYDCVSGVCEPSGGQDAGGTDGSGPRPRLQVCTPEGCDEPLKMNFGGSRIGVTTAQTLTIRSIGELPAEITDISVLNPSATEFRADPSGQVRITLNPSDEQAIRVTHTAADGVADNETLQIISNADRTRVLVQIFTEYKGVPTLYAGADPAANTDLQTIDFGNVRAGVRESKRIYLKNKDRVIDGSILNLSEVRLDPQSSSNFQLALDQRVPAFLSQFNSFCASDATCDATRGDRCDTTLGVCRTSGGGLRDVVTATVSFIGTTPGLIDEALVVTSNDGGTAGATRRISVRANVTFSQLTINPDPVDFAEAFVGFTSRQRVTATNNGTARMVISSIALAPGSAFAVDLSGVVLPLVLDPGNNASFDVSFLPAATGQQSTVLTVVSDDIAEPMKTVTVTGTALIAPELELQPARVNFGDTHINANATVVVTARNNGGSDLRIASIAMSSTTSMGFTADPLALPPIAPGASATFNARFNPTVPTYPILLGGSVELTTNDPRVQPVARVGVAGTAINPTALLIPSGQVNYNTLPQNPNNPSFIIGQQLDTSFTLYNTGAGPLVVLGLSIGNNTSGAFVPVGLPAVPFSIASGAQVALTVRFAPATTGNYASDLSIVTNDLDLPAGTVAVSLLGTAIDCPPRANATGTANAAGQCVYACNATFWDLNGDRNNPSSNGCEYGPCTQQAGPDLPDDTFVDGNCDGIDGDPAQAIFVAPPPAGSDLNPGTRDQPKATIPNAIANAAGRNVYVSVGAYSGPLTLVSGVSIYGGYNQSSSWQRSAANVTSIVSSTNVGVVAFNLGQTTIFDRFTVVAQNATIQGSSSIGVNVSNSGASLQIRNCNITAGDGAVGTPGGVGGPGTDAAQAGVPNPGQMGCDGCSGNGNGGAGGPSPCGMTGGTGGMGGYDNGNGGTGGTGVSPPPRLPTGGGGIGLGAQVCDNTSLCSTCNGSRRNGTIGGMGSDGLTGTSGGGGTGGLGSGSVVGGIWIGSPGNSGAGGGHGSGGGGGGGGGGGADDCYTSVFGICISDPIGCNSDRGGGGGGGGGGGCGGGGGLGGGGGGGSFGIFLVSASPILANNVVTTGRGGNGGRGGDYGGGGSGVTGGSPGTGLDDGGNGGWGGRGGDGGRGGSGGGGGGGVSYCIYRFNSGGTSVSAPTCNLGQGGSGGPGGLLNGVGTGATGATGDQF